MKKKYMKDAITLARWGMENNKGGPFGAIIVMEGEIVGWGCNTVTSSNDPTAHAEVNAIRDACKNMKNYTLEGCEIYTSCEPCPMCLSAIYWARIDKIYYGCNKEDAAYAGFVDDELYRELSLPRDRRSIPTEQLMREDAMEVFKNWREKEDRLNY